MGEIATAATGTEPPASVAPIAPAAGPKPAPAARSDADATVGGARPPIAAEPPIEQLRVEIWIDGQGVVRKTTGAPQLGAETITVLETSADPWLPEYPSPDLLQPLTAETLLVLGL